MSQMEVPNRMWDRSYPNQCQREAIPGWRLYKKERLSNQILLLDNINIDQRLYWSNDGIFTSRTNSKTWWDEDEHCVSLSPVCCFVDGQLFIYPMALHCPFILWYQARNSRIFFGIIILDAADFDINESIQRVSSDYSQNLQGLKSMRFWLILR